MKCGRLITLLVAFLTIVSMLSGCAGNNNAAVAYDNEGSSATMADAVPEDTGADYKVYLSSMPIQDYKGMTFTLTAEDTPQRPNFHTEAYNGEVVNDALYERHLTVSEAVNVEFKYESHGNRNKCMDAVKKVVLAGEHVYDLVINSMTGGGINTIMSAEYLTCISDMPYIDLKQPWWAENIINNFSVGGNLYIASGSISPSFFYSAMASVYNMTKAESLGIPLLYDIVESGDWTIDRMGEYIAIGSADVDGDGEMKRENDFYSLILSSECGRALFISAGGSYVERNNEGTFDITIVSERSLEIAEKVRSVFGNRENSILEDAAAAKLPEFTQCRTLFGISTMNFILTEVRNMEDDFGIIPLPKYDENQAEYITCGNSYLPCGVIIPITCSDTEATGYITEMLACTSYGLLTPAIYEITLQGKLAQDPQSGRMLDIIYNDVNFDIFSAMDYSSAAMMMREYLVGSRDDIVSAYTAVESKVVASFEETVQLLGGK